MLQYVAVPCEMSCSKTVEHITDPFETNSVLNRYEYLRHRCTVPMKRLEFATFVPVLAQGQTAQTFARSNPNNPDTRSKYFIDQLDQDSCLTCPHDPACQWPNRYVVPSAAIVMGHHRQTIPLLQCHVANRRAKRQWVAVSIL
jgi:hypothetical protein